MGEGELEEEACRRCRTCGLRICGLHSDKRDVQSRQLNEGDESTVSSGEDWVIKRKESVINMSASGTTMTVHPVRRAMERLTALGEGGVFWGPSCST